MHPANRLHDAVHQRVRLGLMAVLNEAGKADFSYLKQALELTDGNLARHLQVLEEAGLVRTDKDLGGKRSRTWVRITPQGRRAYLAEVEILRSIIDGHEPKNR